MLQGLFPLAVAWALPLVILLVIGFDNPFPEGAGLHRLWESALFHATLAVILVAGCYGTAWPVYRRWPGFLRLPGGVSVWFVLIRLVVYGVLLFVAPTAAVLSFLTTYVNVVRPADPQYGMGAYWTTFLSALFLTPMVTVLLVWWAAVRRARALRHGAGRPQVRPHRH